MTDFLGRLAARSLGRAPVVQPRLLARFETASTVAEPIEVTSSAHAPVNEHRVSSERDFPVADERGRREWPDDHQPPRPAFPADQMIARKVAGMTDRSADPVPLRADLTGSPQSDRPERRTETMSPRAMAVQPTATADHAPAPHLSRDSDLTRPTPAAPLLPDPHLAVAHVGSAQTILPERLAEDINDRELRPDPRSAVAPAGPGQAIFPERLAENINGRELRPDPRPAVAHAGPGQTISPESLAENISGRALRSDPPLAVAHAGPGQTIFPESLAENINGRALRPDPPLAIAHAGSAQTAVFPTNVADDISVRTPPPPSDPSIAIAHAGPNKPTAFPMAVERTNARAAPVVRVSIGRIEVHAVAAPAAAPRARTTPRVAGPSLEEYLKERSRGP